MIDDYLEKTTCPDCEVNPGELHVHGCDVERCPLCGRQLISCHCIYEVNGIEYPTLVEAHQGIYKNGPTEKMHDRLDAEITKYGGYMPWTGIWPGTEECIEFGWCSYFEPGIGWIRCNNDHPYARPDLNRLSTCHANWNKHTRRWERI